MSALSVVILTLGSLGKGLRKNPTTNLVDVSISTDAANGITLGTDNGLFVTAANQIPGTQGVFEGAFLKVVNGQATWVNIIGGPIVAWPAQGLI